MKLLLLLDYSSYTEKMLAAAQLLKNNCKAAQFTVLHINDERLFYSTTGIEKELGETITRENKELQLACKKYLGDNYLYHEEFGIPKLKIFEAIGQFDFDLILVGKHNNSGLSDRFLGSIAEYVLKNSEKPVMIIP